MINIKKIYNNKNKNLIISNLNQKLKVDSIYDTSDKITDSNSYTLYELNNTFKDKNKNILTDDNNYK